MCVSHAMAGSGAVLADGVLQRGCCAPFAISLSRTRHLYAVGRSQKTEYAVFNELIEVGTSRVINNQHTKYQGLVQTFTFLGSLRLAAPPVVVKFSKKLVLFQRSVDF